MTPRIKNLALFAGAILLVALTYFFVRRGERRRLLCIDAIPADAFLVMTFDVDALRRSPLGAPIFGGASSKLVGERTLTELCGFDPLTRITELAVAVPEGGDPGEFAIVIRADVSKDELVACAGKVIESRQALGGNHPSLRTSGSFTLVEPEAQPGDPAKRFPTLAYRDGGPFVIARGAWLMTMLDTVDGKLPSVRKNDVHMGLRQALGQTDEATPQVAILATAILPKPLRERMKAEMGAELVDPGKGNIMAGVLGVASAGVGVVAGPAGGDSDVAVELRCEDAAGCVEVEKLIGKKRLDWSQDFAIRLLGMGPLLDGMKIENRGAELRVSSRAPTNEAAKWLERVLEVRGIRHPSPPSPFLPPTPRQPPSGSPPPDEVLKPKRAPGTAPGDAGATPP